MIGRSPIVSRSTWMAATRAPGNIRMGVPRANSPCSAFPTRPSAIVQIGSILPYTTGFIDPTSGPNAGVVGGTSQLYEHVMLYRGYGVTDSIGQFRADLDIKGDDPKQGLIDFRVGGYYSHDSKDTALYSNDGLSGNTTSGYNIPSPTSVPIGVFNDGGILSGLSGANRLPTQWLTFNGPALFSNAITQQQAEHARLYWFCAAKGQRLAGHRAGLRRLPLERRVRRQPARPAFHWRATGCSSRGSPRKRSMVWQAAVTQLTGEAAPTTRHAIRHYNPRVPPRYRARAAIPTFCPRCRSGGS